LSAAVGVAAMLSLVAAAVIGQTGDAGLALDYRLALPARRAGWRPLRKMGCSAPGVGAAAKNQRSIE
jgi:hypothetical protein